MKFIAFYDEQMFVNAELIYEISVEETKDTFYLEILMSNKRHEDKMYEVFVETDNWATFEIYFKNFWEDMNNVNVVNVVPRL